MPISYPNGNPKTKTQLVAEAYRRASRRAVEVTLANVEGGAKLNLRNLGAIDRGTLRASIISDITKIGSTGLSVGRVVVTAPYGRWVEYGRKGLVSSPPGTGPNSASAAWPPVKVIEDWVRRKLNIKPDRVVLKSRFYSRYPNKKKERTAALKQASLDKKIKAATFAVCRKIALFGIAPRPFFTPVARRESLAFRRRLAQFINQEIAKVV